MNTIDYKEKYEKYKNKYLLLKNQIGGYKYIAGTYLFFIRQEDEERVKNYINNNNDKILGFDNFTNNLGTHVKFMKLGDNYVNYNGYDKNNKVLLMGVKEYNPIELGQDLMIIDEPSITKEKLFIIIDLIKKNIGETDYEGNKITKIICVTKSANDNAIINKKYCFNVNYGFFGDSIDNIF
jgi:hypothetical protein